MPATQIPAKRTTRSKAPQSLVHDLVSRKPTQPLGVSSPVSGGIGGDTPIVVEIYALGRGVSLVGERSNLLGRQGAFELEANGKFFVFDPLSAEHANGFIAPVEGDVTPIGLLVKAVDQEHQAEFADGVGHVVSPSLKTVILPLPQGLGKTALAPSLALQLGCNSVVDEWHHGVPLTFGALHLSNASDATTKATTAPGTPPAPGQYWPEQGGTYAGVMRGAPGRPAYHLIVATGPAGMAADLAWGPEGKKIAGADCEWDGQANTAAIMASGLDCPAAKFCASLSLEGHTDWYLPSRREQALCYANTPDQFEPRWHWSSTQYSADDAWLQDCRHGYQLSYGKSYEGRCRAVRRLVLLSFNSLDLSAK